MFRHNSSRVQDTALRDPDSRADQLFDCYYESLFGYLYRLTDDRDRAGSLAEQTILQAVRDRRARSDPSGAGARAWLYRIATALALGRPVPLRPEHTWVRRLLWREAGQRRVPSEASGWRVPDTSAPAPVFGRPTPLESALAALTLPDRAALLLYSRYQLSLPEVAQALDLDQEQALLALAEARQRFRAAFDRARNR